MSSSIKRKKNNKENKTDKVLEENKLLIKYLIKDFIQKEEKKDGK